MKKKLLSFVLGFLAIFALVMPTKATYADSVQYTVNYYDTTDGLLSSDTFNEGELIAAPEITPDSGYVILWYTSSARTATYDFNTPISANLNLYAGQVEAKTITYTKRAASYTDGADASQYETWSEVDVISGSYTNAIEAEELTGFDFSHWSDTPNGAAFSFYNNTISDNITLYPVYTIKTFTVKFYVNGNLYETQTIEYNQTPTAPAYTSDRYNILGWEKAEVGASGYVDFATQYITADCAYEAVLEQKSVNISVVSNSSYYTLQETPPTILDCGDVLVVKLKLVDEFSNHELVTTDLKIVGTYDEATINYDEVTQVYTIVLTDVSSDVVFDLKPLPINQYDVTLPVVEGITYTITTPSADYTFAGGVYTLGITKAFTFTVSVNEGYYAKVLAFGQCTNNSGTYVLNVRADINIVSNSEVVKYHTFSFAGNDNVQISLENNYLKQEGSNYWYENGTTASFTYTANSGYFVKNIVGATFLSNKYNTQMSENKVVTFTVVECYTLTLTTVTGLENVIVNNYLARDLNDYTIESGADVTVSYSLSSAYSDSNVSLTAGSCSVVKGTNSFTIQNVTENATIAFAGVVLNNCVVTLNSNDMASLAGNTSVAYGSNIDITFALSAAYSNATIAKENFSITGNYFEYSISGSTLTITMVTGDIVVEVVDLAKNTYTITLQENVYGTLAADDLTVEHGSNVEFSPVLATMYTKATLAKANIEITGLYASYNVEANVVTVNNITGDVTLSLKDLTINTYLVKMPLVQTGKFTISTISKYVEHGGNMSFSITINESCSQNVDTFVLKKNGTVLTGTKNGLVFTYSLTNITEEITLTASDINKNVYNVDFLDTSVEPNPTLSVSLVEYGSVITAPNPEKSGYRFDGWFTDTSFTTQFDFNTQIKANTVVYAKYTIMKYDVVFVANGIIVDTITIHHGTLVNDNAPAIPAREGYTQVAPFWDFAAAGYTGIIDKAATVYAVYTINTYTVTFKTPFSQTPMKVETVDYDATATPPTNTAVTGYTFEYWDNTFNNVRENTIVNAIYSINVYDITFVNGNTDATVYTQQAEYNSTIERPIDSAVVSVGNTVYGWYKDPEMTISYDFSSSIKNDLTIYGDIDVTRLKLRFVAEGKVIKEEIINYGEDYNQAFPEIPAKKGHTALGWSQDSVKELTTNLDIVANYQINTYTVTFKYSDGTTEEVTVVYGTTISELPNKGQGFGVKVSADMNKLKNIDSDLVINVKITDFSYLIYIACGVVALGLIVAVVILSVRANSNSKEIKEANANDVAKKAEKQAAKDEE